MKIANVELKSAAYKPPAEKPGAVHSEAQVDPVTQYPRIESYGPPIPGIEELEPGRKYIVYAVAECTRVEINKQKEGEQKVTGGLDIHMIGFKPYSKKKIDDMDESEIEEMQKSGMEPEDDD